MKCLLIHEVKATDSKITCKRTCFRLTFLVGDNSVVAVTPRNEGEITLKDFVFFPFHVSQVSMCIMYSELFFFQIVFEKVINSSGNCGSDFFFPLPSLLIKIQQCLEQREKKLSGCSLTVTVCPTCLLQNVDHVQREQSLPLALNTNGGTSFPAT